MILIIGATGNVGGAVADRLVERGIPIRVLARDPAKAARLSAAGAEVVAGDLGRPETLPDAFAGVDRVLLSTSPGPTLVAEQTAAIEAALAALVGRVVRVSALDAKAGSDVNLLDWHGRLDDALRASGLAWTILQPARWFLQNYLMQADSIAQEGVIYGAMREGRVAPVDAGDVAAVAAVALTEPGDDHVGQVYVITGPESLSQPQAAAAIGRGIGAEVRYVDLPPESLGNGLREAGLPPWLVEGMLGLQAGFAEGHGDGVTDVVERVGRVTPTSVESFAAAHASVFAPSRNS